MSDLSRYFLRENPFPQTAVIDPSSDDPRINGSIFLEDIFRRAIDNLRQKTERGVNVVYIAGIQYDKGIGKSALMIHHWRECCNSDDTISLYLRCGERDSVRDICRKVLESWHRQDALWNTFRRVLIQFSKERKDPRLAEDAVEAMFNAFPHMPASLPLTLYTQVLNVKLVAENLAAWAAAQTNARKESLLPLFVCYLTKPSEFPEELKGRSIDVVELYQDFVKLMAGFGYNRHFLFLDQFEDMIMGTKKSGIGLLCVSMKRMIEASGDRVTVFVTLHPNSEDYLRMPQAKDLTGVAPLDGIHRVDVMLLDRRGESAVTLALEYFKYFRAGDPPYPTFPIRPELIEFVCFLHGGVIREVLQQLHNCLDHVAQTNMPELTLEYALKHSLEVFGKEVQVKTVEAFQRAKRQEPVGGTASRSLDQLVSDFKKKTEP